MRAMDPGAERQVIYGDMVSECMNASFMNVDDNFAN